MYISRVKKLSDLKEKFCKLFNEGKTKFYDDTITPPQIKFWKLPSTISIIDLRNSFTENLNDLVNSDTLIDNENLTFLERKIFFHK